MSLLFRGLFVSLLLIAAAPASGAAPSSVFLEDLTWNELRDAIRAGKTTIIVPVGGTEQSGPCIALGKHNARVRVLAQRIAETLGNALVAPVIAYVPEGNLTPPTSHMRFPGTITVPHGAFVATLESAAQSFKIHGFRDIVFLGDHGGYQNDLRRAAARLNAAWVGSGAKAFVPLEYYEASTGGFARLLRARGYTESEIGEHAGLADTSLELAVAPQMVRDMQLCDATPNAEGVSGDPRRASAELGKLGANAVVERTVQGIKHDADPPAVDTIPGMPPVVDPANLYSEAGAGHLSPAVQGALSRVYVPNLRSGDVYVIDPATFKVVDRFRVGSVPQHVVPSWDLQTLWVTNNASRSPNGSLTPIDPKTGKPGAEVAVDDPYNMYFTADGMEAIVVAEALARLDFRDPHTMELHSQLQVPKCKGINHADFSIDGRYAIFTCEFGGGGLAKIDMVHRKVVGYLRLGKMSMPQDIRVSPDGKLFYVADMMDGGVKLIDGDRFTQVGFIATGVGPHGLYPSRDGTKLYVANRGSTTILGGEPHGPGSISVIDFATRKVIANWPIPGGGSPDMGNVSADGKTLWLSGRFDNVVYAIDTTTGTVRSIKVGTEPHGLTVWPQPGRYSLGHTGNMR
ncbi:MAG: creatininase family protein [Sphingomonadaceae bacterium]